MALEFEAPVCSEVLFCVVFVGSIAEPDTCVGSNFEHIVKGVFCPDIDSGIDIAPSDAIVSVTVISEIAEKDINVCADIRGKLRCDIEFKFCIGV